jgi:hypothetical protein
MSEQSGSTYTFDVESILSTLKDFQRDTVEYVFDRMYGEQGADRFLVADEVGLGKTLVAKGIVAKIVDVLRQKADHRIDIVYLCANRDIARQNINRLNLFGSEHVSQATRLTLLPLHLKQLRDGPNFVAFTPATALDLGWATGVARERALLYLLLRDVWDLTGAAPKNFFQVYKGNDAWDREVDRLSGEIGNLEGGEIDTGVISRFSAELAKSKGLRPAFDAALEHFQRRRDEPQNLPRHIRELRDPLIGQFRECLARACLSALEPDLIILDEFQRFSSLLGGDQSEHGKEIAELGQQFLAYPGAKILLLSATPYKAYTLAHESGTDNHHKDFLRVASFLLNDASRFEDLKRCLKEFNEALFDTTTQSSVRLATVKHTMEATLRRHIVRTERLAVTVDRDGMIEEMLLPACRLEVQDLEAFKALDAVARSLEQPDIVEYWKSAPFVLNFMERDGYVFKRALVSGMENGVVKVPADRVAGLRGATLRSSALAKFDPFDLQNSRLRALVSVVLDKGAWKLLWIPPSLPYYTSSGTPYSDLSAEAITKVLVFSNWRFVPRAIAALVSYETERRIAKLADERLRYEDLSGRGRRPLLTFSLDEQGEPRDLNHLVPLYPSPSLCELLDPLEEAKRLAAQGHELAHLSLLKMASERVANLIPTSQTGGGEREDQRWYGAAMLDADLRTHKSETSAWFDQRLPWSSFVEARNDEDSGEGGFKIHVDRFIGSAGSGNFGKMPDDLVGVLAKVAIGSPAVVALRSFRRLVLCHGVVGYPVWLLDAAARVGLAFRTMFSQPDATILTRALYGGQEERYWEAMLDHCIAGNLQAVMDEQVHVLREFLGVATNTPEEAIKRIAEEIVSGMTLRATVLRVDDFRVGEALKLADKQIPFRCRSALRFDTDPGEDGGGDTRADQVRVAFNSPFRPFVLASTAVGQEGLDFHLWCHAIFHWNLPPSPVDFEQREGRVHRYKGHVVRRSVAAALGIAVLHGTTPGKDPWEDLFSIARTQRAAGTNDLVPYWVFNGNGEIKIRRYIPALPLSRERAASIRLRAALGAYRLVFGQPRQEDLLAFLQSAHAKGDINADLYAIDLSPRAHVAASAVRGVASS